MPAATTISLTRVFPGDKGFADQPLFSIVPSSLTLTVVW